MFYGLGDIGIPTAVLAAKHGVQVAGVDLTPLKVRLSDKSISFLKNQD